MVLKCPEVRETWRGILTRRIAENCRMQSGPVAQFLWAVRALKWGLCLEGDRPVFIMHNEDEIQLLNMELNYV